MNDREYLGIVKSKSEHIKSKIIINLREGKHYVKNNVDTYVEVEVPPYFLDRTNTNKTPPFYNKSFTVDLPSLSLEKMLCKSIVLTVYEKSKIPYLEKKPLGRVVIEVATLWSEPDNAFHGKLLTLINRHQNDFTIRGYLLCDISIFFENSNLMKLYSPQILDTRISKLDYNDDEQFVPNGYKLASTHLAKYLIKFHKGEILTFLMENGTKWLSVDFAVAPESTIIINLKKESNQIWDLEYSTINVYPPLCPTITIKLILSGNIIAIKTLSMHDFMKINGLLCFGPAFIHLSTLETNQYIGKILLSVNIELVPSEIEYVSKLLSIEKIPSISNEVFMYSKIIIFGIIFDVNYFQKSISNVMSLSLNFGEYNINNQHNKDADFIHTLTPEYQLNLDDEIYNLLIPSNIKPSLILLTNISEIECQAMLATNFFYSIISQMEMILSKYNDYYPSNSLESTKQMLKYISEYCLIIKKNYKQNVTFRKSIHKSCVNSTSYILNLCIQQEKYLTNEKFNNISKVIENVQNKLDQIKITLFHTCNGPPDIILKLWNSKKSISKCQMQIGQFLYSNRRDAKGKLCGKMHSWLLSSDDEDNVFEGIVQAIFWVGPYNEFNECLKSFPGIILTNTEILSTQYRFEMNETILQFNIHVSQAALNEICYKRYGQLNLMIRATILAYSMKTKVINTTLSPFWNVTLLSKPYTYVYYKNSKAPIYVIFQLFNIKTRNRKTYEKIIGYAISRLEISDMNVQKKLKWIKIFDKIESIGKLFASVEMTNGNIEPTESNKFIMRPMSKELQPMSRYYRLNVLFWGIRNLKLYHHELYVDMSCSGSGVKSNVLKNVAFFPNFPDEIKYTFTIELPESIDIIPPITFQLFSKLKLKKKFHQIGMSAPQSVKQFLVSSITEIESNILKSQIPLSTVVQMDDDNSSNYDDENIEYENHEITKDSNKLKKHCSYLLNKIVKGLNLPCLKIFNQIVISLLKLKCTRFIDFFDDKYEKIKEETEEEVDYNWWSKYYASKIKKNNFYKNDYYSTKNVSKTFCKILPFCKCCKEFNTNYTKNRSSKIVSLIVYDEELESISEFNGFKDNLKSFEIYGYSNDDDISPSVVATLKANVQIRPELQSNDELKFSKLKELFLNSLEYQNWPNIKSNIKCKVLVRVYIIRAYDLHPSDSCSLADPYVEVLFGKKHKISDHNKYVPKTLNPIFGRCYQKVISFPDCSTLIVKIMDHDNFGQDDLIGETSIDIESRYYSRHRPSCGLTRHYDRTGYNKWRDYETPSKILHSLCESNNLKPPTYFKNCVTIGPKKFTIIEHNSVPDKQTLALHVLNHWHEIPVLGYSLVPEHVETRTLQNSNFPNIQRGKLEMWVDIFPQKSTLPNPVDITHPVAEELELRVIVWSVAEVKLVDDNFITGEKHSDIFIKGWLPSVDEQFTDIHYRSLNGEGYFNWRFKFPFSYMKAENRIVEKSKGFFSLEAEEKIYLPRLHIQVWDNDCLTPDSYIGYLSLDLWNLPMGTKSSWKCSLIDDQTPRINLFKTKNTRGWWPFISIENNKNVLVGKIDAELQILTKLEAEKSPAGFGREEPQPLPTPKRHATYFLNSIIDPCAIIIQYFFSVNKVKFFEVFCILGVILFLLLFLYSIPGYTVKKLMHA